MQEKSMAHREKASKEGARIAAMAKKAQLLKENKLKKNSILQNRFEEYFRNDAKKIMFAAKFCGSFVMLFFDFLLIN